MKGKRFGIIVATIAMFGILLSPAGVQGAVSVGAEVAADTSSLLWGQSTVIRWNTTVSSGGTGYYNGTVYINVTSPSMDHYYYTSAVVLDLTVIHDEYNFSFDPNEAGRWTISADLGGADALNNITVPDSTGSFSVETSGTAMGRMIQDMTGTLFLIVMIMVLFVIMVLVLGRVSKGGGKSDGKKT